ncbi:serine hydrolase domain-containing protein [Halobacillus sp. Marseille-P3879]|uniref:serine hydrolase domain-containing protein n=1 Tax=Halobacillus TaxID=45667 RepID=UPI000C7D1E43|nr:serine hydrolase [Halobacillus sp. Marseille-P3879]
MIKINQVKEDLAEEIEQVKGFSGAVYVKGKGMTYQGAYGFRNREENLPNNPTTRFGIASGCKLFTAVAIAQLVDQGLLNFHTRLDECLNLNFTHFDPSITIHQLLTHSSGIPDYFDEEGNVNFEELWKEQPTYELKELKNFLPMFQHERMKFLPGEKFHYNNAGYIILGLIIEQQTRMKFTDYVEEHVLKKAGMDQSGYFSINKLPRNTANGYIDLEDGSWKTNIFSIPIKGGADGGAFVTTPDMVRFWDSLLNCELISEENTIVLLSPHAQADNELYYGYGVWMNIAHDEVYKYHVMGYDPGVSFHSAFYPQLDLTLAAACNKNVGAYEVVKAVEKVVFHY